MLAPAGMGVRRSVSARATWRGGGGQVQLRVPRFWDGVKQCITSTFK